MGIYTYYDYARKYPQVVRIEADGIIAADALVKQQGFNPLALSCCPGIRISLVSTLLASPRRFKALTSGGASKKLAPHVHYPASGDEETLYPSGVVFSTAWSNTKRDALEKLLSSKQAASFMKALVRYEYAGPERYRQCEIIYNLKAEWLLQDKS